VSAESVPSAVYQRRQFLFSRDIRVNGGSSFSIVSAEAVPLQQFLVCQQRQFLQQCTSGGSSFSSVPAEAVPSSVPCMSTEAVPSPACGVSAKVFYSRVFIVGVYIYGSDS
jgi:hypothetical protein